MGIHLSLLSIVPLKDKKKISNLEISKARRVIKRVGESGQQ